MDIKTCTWLLEETLDVEVDDNVAVLFADDAAFIYHLAMSVTHVDVYDFSQTRLTELAHELRNGPDNLEIHDTVYPPEYMGYDTVLMLSSKGRDYARGMLIASYQALKPGGSVYIAGATKEGGKSVIADAKKLYGNATTLIYKRNHRVGQAFKPEDASLEPPIPDDWKHAPIITPQERVFDTPLGELPVLTMPGIFSWDRLDDGTAYLLEEFDLGSLNPADSVLDVGCGVGVLGALAARFAGDVTLVDDNLLAVQAAGATLRHNDILNAQVLAGDVYGPVGYATYDLILCNPPFHRGFDVSTDMAERVIREAPDHLNPGGALVMVSNAFLNYDEYAEGVFNSLSIYQNPRYKVMVARG